MDEFKNEVTEDNGSDEHLEESVSFLSQLEKKLDLNWANDRTNWHLRAIVNSVAMKV